MHRPSLWTERAIVMDRFREIAGSLLSLPGVEEGTGFGPNSGLRVNGKIFVILTDAGLVVKLPAVRCQELIDGKSITLWNRGGTRPLREWLLVSTTAEALWLELAEDAFSYVSLDEPR